MYWYQHDDIIKWKHFPRYWRFVWGIHRLPVNSPHKGQWCGALMFSLICTWINGWVNNHEAGDLRRHHAHYDVTVMKVTFHGYQLQAFNVLWIVNICSMVRYHKPDFCENEMQCSGGWGWGWGVGGHYKVVQYNMILHTSLQQLRQNMNQEFESIKRLLIPCPNRRAMGLWEFWRNWWHYNSTALLLVFNTLTAGNTYIQWYA